MEFTFDELENEGFKQNRLNDDTYLGLSLENGSFLLVKKTGGQMYEMHGARDFYGQEYKEAELSNFDFENLTLRDFVEFIKNPNITETKIK